MFFVLLDKLCGELESRGNLTVAIHLTPTKAMFTWTYIDNRIICNFWEKFMSNIFQLIWSCDSSSHIQKKEGIPPCCLSDSLHLPWSLLQLVLRPLFMTLLACLFFCSHSFYLVCWPAVLSVLFFLLYAQIF